MRHIITNNEAALRVVCEAVLPEEGAELVATLERELNYVNRTDSSGIGLACPQIGIAKQVAIIRLPNFSVNLVNAKLDKCYDEVMFRGEGCLSFPGRIENTLRYQEVVVTNSVEPYHFIATGFNAIAIQHELDHLNQKLFFDHLAPKAAPVRTVKIGPNDKCPCNSGKKYKKCCSK
jgi:peptide deformylase